MKQRRTQVEGGLNTYAYEGGNPISLTDPSGLSVLLCSSKLGGTAPRSPSQISPVRHDYLVVNGKSYGFEPAGNPILSKGNIRNSDDPNNSKCETLVGDNSNDQAVLDAIQNVGTPTYSVIAAKYPYAPSIAAWAMGARNCQSWIDDIRAEAGVP